MPGKNKITISKNCIAYPFKGDSKNIICWRCSKDSKHFHYVVYHISAIKKVSRLYCINCLNYLQKNPHFVNQIIYDLEKIETVLQGKNIVVLFQIKTNDIEKCIEIIQELK